MNIFQKAAFRLVKNSIDEYIKSFMKGDDIPTSTTSKETAMKYTAVFSCVRVLSETFASAPLMVYRKLKDGDRETANDLSLYDVLHNRPNKDMSPFNFKESSMMSINLGGNAVCHKETNRYGEIIGLNPVNEMLKDIKRNADGQLTYILRVNNADKEYTRKDIFHVPGMSYDGIIGISPISYFAQSINLGLTYEAFGNQFYKNGAHASGAFSFPNELSDAAFARLKDGIKKNYTSLVNAGTPILLEAGGKFEPFTIKPVDAQLIESKRFQIGDIARIYRVPLHLLQDLERATFSNIEHQSLEFIMYTMLPWFKRWEENINMQLLTKKERMAGYYVESLIAGLLRGDMKSRYESYVMGRLNGWLSINDIRRLENMNRVEGGDSYIQPLNYINIEKADEYYAKEKENIENMLKGGDKA